jgi:hypothetical protein
MRVLLNPFLYDLTAQMGLNLLIITFSRLHSYKTHLVRLLWQSDRPVTETSDSTQQSMERSMPPAGFKTAIPASDQP